MPFKRGRGKDTESKAEKEKPTKNVKENNDVEEQSKSDHHAKCRDPKDPSTFEVKGLCAAPHTPFDKKNNIKLDVIPKLIDRYIRNGVYSAFINGTTGEGLAMSVEERKTVAEEWMKCAKGKDMSIICHVGCEALPDTIELAKHAESIGCCAIAITPPSFYKPANIDALIEWLKSISLEVPKMPMYYYHYSDMNGVTITTNLFLEKAVGVVKTLCGMKYTHYNLLELERCLYVDDHHFNILMGREDGLLPALMAGIIGGIGATYNCIGGEFSKLLSNYESGNYAKAREIQEKVNGFASLLYHNNGKYGVGGIELLKEVVCMTGIDVGQCRIPRKGLTTDAKKQLKKDLESIKFFDWCDK